jgi:hypothetical protein
MLASLICNSVLAVPAAQRKKPIAVLCTDTRVEIPAIAEIVEGALSRMHKFSVKNSLNIEVNLLKSPPSSDSGGSRKASRFVQRAPHDDSNL